METNYFTKMFYLKKFFLQKMNKKKQVRKLKDSKELKTVWKNHMDKNKEKQAILCEAGAFYTMQRMF